MGQRNTNPIGSEADEAAGPLLHAACEIESIGSLGLPAMQGVSGSAMGSARGSASFGDSNLATDEEDGVAKLLR
eukprot:5446273-Karenia_brevis.AAC.1